MKFIWDNLRGRKISYRSNMEDSYIVQVGRERETVDLGGRHTVFDLEGAMIQNEHGASGQHEQNGDELRVEENSELLGMK